MNATALPGKEVAKLSLTARHLGHRRPASTAWSPAVRGQGLPVDEFLGSAGCLQYDLCYVVVDGLAKVKSPTRRRTTTVAIGGVVVPGATTGGTVVAQDTTATGAALFNQIQNAIGRAATAVAANSTSFVVDVGATRR
jgi:hypothetical protein